MPEQLLYGTAYYYEYLPCDRMEEDFCMMREAGFNMIRIAESTWSTWEPSDGAFDFTSLHSVLQAACRHGLSVIVGTPTYAVPPWLAKKYPDLLSDTHSGPCRYGPRQNFDLTHPGYRFHAERIIRKLLEQVQNYPCVIGFQLDNETKPYDTCSPRAQALFRDWLKERFPSEEALNQEMGLAYWSNSINSWEDLPDVRGTINGSLGAEYEAFQRHLVTEFLAWQRQILEEYRRPEQFVTHNFDLEWRLFSYGLQPEVDQFQAARALTVAGCDIYHPSQDHLTGAEITFGGALTRGLKQDNYLVLETQAQGNFGWLPYPGQLRLQAFSHLASGADCVSYWHWHSIHNAVESYWKGVLSHDFSRGAVYQEASAIGRDFQRLSSHLIHLKKKNRIAVMVSNRSLTGFRWFPTCQQGDTPDHNYNDYLRWICDACYRLNLEYDIVDDHYGEDELEKLRSYDLIFLPGLYSAPEELLKTIRRYVKEGGAVIASFRTAFSDPYLKIYHDPQPHGLTEVFGLTYDRFTRPEGVRLASQLAPLPENRQVTDWMELLTVSTAQAICTYEHPFWNHIPAVTKNRYGDGQAIYLGCCMEEGVLEALLRYLLPELGIAVPEFSFPLIRKGGVNQYGHVLNYYLNYSGRPQTTPPLKNQGRELLADQPVQAGERLELLPWDVKIIEELPDSPRT